jgi:hypothetical protein
VAGFVGGWLTGAGFGFGGACRCGVAIGAGLLAAPGPDPTVPVAALPRVEPTVSIAEGLAVAEPQQSAKTAAIAARVKAIRWLAKCLLSDFDFKLFPVSRRASSRRLLLQKRGCWGEINARAAK